MAEGKANATFAVNMTFQVNDNGEWFDAFEITSGHSVYFTMAAVTKTNDYSLNFLSWTVMDSKTVTSNLPDFNPTAVSDYF